MAIAWVSGTERKELTTGESLQLIDAIITQLGSHFDGHRHFEHQGRVF